MTDSDEFGKDVATATLMIEEEEEVDETTGLPMGVKPERVESFDNLIFSFYDTRRVYTYFSFNIDSKSF